MGNSGFEDDKRIDESQGELRRVTSRIIGAEVEHGFPSVCHIQIFKKDRSIVDPEFMFTCTGTLIAPRLVVFAAHCVQVGLITRIHVTFDIGSKSLTIPIDIKDSLFKNTTYDQSVISGASDQKTKIKMTQNDIAFLVLPEKMPRLIQSLKPMPMMPMLNLAALKHGKYLTNLTAVGYGRFSNVEAVNKSKAHKKRSAQFSEWSVDTNTDILTITSKQGGFKATGEHVNIAKGDSGGAIICVYQGVPYLVGVISYYDLEKKNKENPIEKIARSYAVGVDLIDTELMSPQQRNSTFANLFHQYRQSDAPYGFNFRGQGGASYQAILSHKVSHSVFKPNALGDMENVSNIQGVELVGEVKWFRDPKFQLALACAPIVISAIIGLRLGLDFDDE